METPSGSLLDHESDGRKAKHKEDENKKPQKNEHQC